MTSVTVVTATAEANAGSMRSTLRPKGDQHTADAGHNHVRHHRYCDDQRQVLAALPYHRNNAHQET